MAHSGNEIGRDRFTRQRTKMPKFRIISTINQHSSLYTLPLRVS